MKQYETIDKLIVKAIQDRRNPLYHNEVVKLHCPTWGGRGSDSQGYRNKPQEDAR